MQRSLIYYVSLILIPTAIQCDQANRKDTDEITLLTYYDANPAKEEALARFARRAIYDGFVQGSTFRIVEASKVTKAANYSQEFRKLETIRSVIYKLSSIASLHDILMYVENDVSMILSPPPKIISVFKETNTQILISAGTTPCGSPLIENTHGNKGFYGNIAGFIGYSNVLKEIFSNIEPYTSLQHLFQQINQKDSPAKTKYKIELDITSKLFTTIPQSSKEVNAELQLTMTNTYLIPKVSTKSNPKRPIHILQTDICKSGNSGAYLNAIGSYLTPTLQDDRFILPEADDELPTVALTIFIERPTPFMEEFFQNIEKLDYPKNKIFLFIHNHYKYNTVSVEMFLEAFSKQYKTVKYIRSKERIKEWVARKIGVEWAIENEADYWFSVDSTARFDDEETLKNLIEANKLIISPMLCTNTDFLPNICNWWGAVTPDGFFSKSSDYDDIAEDRHKGVWNVPYISSSYLIKRSILIDPETRPNFILGMLDADLAFAANNRARGIFMHVTNEFHPGHLVLTENFQVGHLHNELFQIFDNRYDWENRYIHPNYTRSLSKEYVPIEPCKDVYWFPIVTPRFAKEMIEEAENFGRWSDGSIEARGDLYPTVDIQLHEIGFDRHFHEFLRLYITPIQEKVFPGYEVYPPKTHQAFVLKYSAVDQKELKPHFDESTYTLNIALNTPKKDFEGGGCRFTRFNCSVVDTRLGWAFLHPGQFTHKHEGLKVTNGVRYILVAFVDPHEPDEG